MPPQPSEEMPPETRSGAHGDGLEPGAGRQGALELKTWIRNSPWLAIAILIHVMLVAVLSVVYMAKERRPPTAEPIAVSIADTPLELPDPIEEPPEIIDRNSVPLLPN